MALPTTRRRRHSSATLEPPDTRPTKPDGAGVVTGLPLGLLRGEGVALLAMATVLYGNYGRSWWLFVLLLPAPTSAYSAACGACVPLPWPTT